MAKNTFDARNSRSSQAVSTMSRAMNEVFIVSEMGYVDLKCGGECSGRCRFHGAPGSTNFASTDSSRLHL